MSGPARPGAESERATGAALTVLTAAAGLACLLPWEHLEVRIPGTAASSRPLGSFHGAGVLACAGAAVELLALSLRVLGPGRRRLVAGLVAAGGAMLAAGAGLYVVAGGDRVGGVAGGLAEVTLSPWLPVAGITGVLLAGVGAVMLASPRGGSRRRTSGAGR